MFTTKDADKGPCPHCVWKGSMWQFNSSYCRKLRHLILPTGRWLLTMRYPFLPCRASPVALKELLLCILETMPKNNCQQTVMFTSRRWISLPLFHPLVSPFMSVLPESIPLWYRQNMSVGMARCSCRASGKRRSFQELLQ